IEEWKATKKITSNALGGGVQRTKAQALLDGKSWQAKTKKKGDESLGVTDGEWDGIKTSSFFANIAQHLDPARYKQVFGEGHFVTVDRHIADMFDPGLGQSPGQYYEGIAQAIVALAEKAGMTPSEFQAAAWVTWKAKKLLRENKRYTEERAWQEAMDAYEIGVNRYSEVPDSVAKDALASLEARVRDDPEVTIHEQTRVQEDLSENPRGPLQGRPLFPPKRPDQRYAEILRKTAIHFGSKRRQGPTDKQLADAEDYLWHWSQDNMHEPVAQKFLKLYHEKDAKKQAAQDESFRTFLTQRGGDRHPLSGLSERLNEPDGGFTAHLDGTPDDATGDFVAAYGAYEKVIPVAEATPEVLAKHFDEMRGRAKRHQTTDGVQLRVGAWHNPEDGMIYLDLSRVFPNAPTAMEFAKREGQLAIFDRTDFKSIPTGLEGPIAQLIKDRLRDNASLDEIPTAEMGNPGSLAEEQALQPRTTELGEIPTYSKEDMPSGGMISDTYGPKKELDPLQDAAMESLREDARNALPPERMADDIGLMELNELVEIPPDAFMLSAREAMGMKADPKFVYHGTDRQGGVRA
ncbi:MAG TPA: hypothetical protein VGP38_02980, partial [Rubrobacter sp.]|nr:hypothetical protein [Rubrobacter sp.]